MGGGDQESIAIGLPNLAMVSLSRDTTEGVRKTLLDVLAIVDGIGSKPVGKSLLEVCAGLAASNRDWPRVARFYGAAEAEAARTGLRRDPTDEAFLAPLVARARRSDGADVFLNREIAGRSLTYADAIEEARKWLASDRAVS
jgi:hypothetical protein